jgi:hypothetical protein
VASLPGRPLSLVRDPHRGIIGAVQRHRGRGKNAVPIHCCEYHLLTRARKALKQDGLAWDPRSGSC